MYKNFKSDKYNRFPGNPKSKKKKNTGYNRYDTFEVCVGWRKAERVYFDMSLNEYFVY